MPRPRVVSAKNRPQKHVDLSDGDWVNLKQKLNYGEASILYDATYRSNVGGGGGTSREMQMAVFNVQRILLYVLEWSFIDDENKPLPVSADSIRSLDPETANELHEAISAIEAENERIEREKTAPAPNGTAAAPTPASKEPSKV